MKAQDKNQIATLLAGMLVVLMAVLMVSGMAWSGDRPTTLWTAEEAGSRTECVTRTVSDGVEIQLIADGAAVYNRVFNDREDALQFAEDARPSRSAERPAVTASAPRSWARAQAR